MDKHLFADNKAESRNRLMRQGRVRLSRMDAVAIIAAVVLLFCTTGASAKRKRVPTKKDSIQLKIDSIQTAFLNLKQNYDKENEKAYLKQKYDTAKIFSLTLDMFNTLEELDRVDAEKNIKPKYRKKNSELLDGYRRNLFNGANFYIRRGKNKEAYALYDKYISCGDQPMFEQYSYNTTDSLLPNVGFWAIVAASLQGSHQDVLKYSDLAYKWTRKEQVLQFKAEAYHSLDSIGPYVSTLQYGFDEFPHYVYFFNSLVEYYSEKEQFDDALDLCEKALNSDVAVDKELFRSFSYAKSGLLLKQQKWDECIPVCEQLILCDSTFAMPYHNIGVCYLNKAEVLTRKEKKEKRALLNMARKYLETYRDMAPKDKERWAPLLYRVYFNLNLGKHFRDMETKLK